MPESVQKRALTGQIPGKKTAGEVDEAKTGKRDDA